jgi:hypothetical protein
MTTCILCGCYDVETPAEMLDGAPYAVCLEHLAAFAERARKPAPPVLITFGALSLEQACAAAALTSGD